MTSEQASDVFDYMLRFRQLGDAERQAVVRAKQALDIIGTLEANLNLQERVTISRQKNDEWTVTRGHRTHLGDSLADAFGQLCQTLIMEKGDG